MIIVKMKKIRILAMDIDGTLTDGSIYISNNGEIMKRFDVKDGLGISLLRHSGIIPAIITGRNSQIVMTRARELDINHVVQGVTDKKEAMIKLAQENQVSLDEIAYIGDDLNDLPALRIAGLAVCPSDAVDEVKKNCDVILQHQGGKGCVREIVENLLQAQGIYEKVLEDLYHYEQ